MKMYVFKNYEFSTPKFDFCSLVKKIINILKCLCKYYVRGIMAKPKTYIRQNGIRLLPHTTIQHLSVVVVHTHTLPFFPHPHVLFKCLLNPEKIWKNFFEKFCFNFFEVVIIWTVHLDVRKLCGCGHFWGYCGVCGQQPQQQLLSAHCCGAVTA